jgi:hypothetical protein
MKKDMELGEKLKELEEQIEFIKAVISLQLGENQLEQYFEEWKKKQGVFRSSQLR